MDKNVDKADNMTNDTDDATNIDNVQFSIIFDDDADADDLTGATDIEKAGSLVDSDSTDSDNTGSVNANDNTDDAEVDSTDNPSNANNASAEASSDKTGDADSDTRTSNADDGTTVSAHESASAIESETITTSDHADANLDAAAANANRVNETLNLSVTAKATAANATAAAGNATNETADPALRLSSRIDKELQHDAGDDILLKSYPTFGLNKVTVTNRKTGRHVLDRLDHAFYAGHMYAMLLPADDVELHETLMATMSGVLIPNEGNVMNKSANFTELEPLELRGHRLGLIPQRYALRDDLSAEQNLVYAMDASGRTFLKPKPVIARELLQRVHFHPDTPNAPVSKLNPVDQRRVAIARAISCEAEVLIADEPTGGLNDDDSVAILQLLTSLTHGDPKHCVIVLTESEAVANTAETIVEL